MSRNEKRKKYLQKYYQNNKERLSKINVESNRRYRKNNPWMESYYKINQRCNNKKCKDYPRYGGRGIRSLLTKEEIEEIWFRDKAYNMEKPSIDRIDNDGHYEYNNCQFLENSDNSRKNKIGQKVGQYTLEGKLIKIWDYQLEISKTLNYSQPHLSRAINNNRTAYGYKWEYINEKF